MRFAHGVVALEDIIRSYWRGNKQDSHNRLKRQTHIQVDAVIETEELLSTGELHATRTSLSIRVCEG